MLEVRELSVTYGKIRAVAGVSLSVSDGQIVTLIGANGAGKSSTLAAISGLVRPSGGSILFNGEELTRLGSHEIVARGIVQVPEGRAILHQMSVAENLELGAYGRRDRQSVRADLERYLAHFPVLGQRRHAPAGSLSGGEQQMLAIARGLMARPKLLLLDEPSMGLAPQMVRRIFEIVRDIHAQGTTILLVEQNARRALAIADHGYVLESGRVVLSGPARDLLHDRATVEAYLGEAVLDRGEPVG